MGKSVPITITVDEDQLATLKSAAQSLTQKAGVNVTYGELIRNAITNSILIGFGPKPKNEVAEMEKWVNHFRDILTPEDIELFNSSEDGVLMRSCIKTGDYTPVVEKFRQIGQTWLRSRTLAATLLRFSTEKDENEGKLSPIMRGPATIAYALSRRGTTPHTIMEAESLIVPDMKIAAYPTFRGSERKPWFMMKGLGKAVAAMARQWDYNLLSALKNAAFARDQVVRLDVEASANQYNMRCAICQVVQHGLVPTQVITGFQTYVDFHGQGGNEFQAPPLKVALETRNYGTYCGIPVTPNLQVSAQDVFVVSSYRDIGVYTQITPFSIKHIPEPTADRDGFVFMDEGRITICNDYAFSLITASTGPSDPHVL